MSRNRLYLGLIIAAILAVILYASLGLYNMGRELPYYSVSVIVEESSNDKWNALKEGLDQGVSENHIYINMVSTTKFSELSEETAIIAREIENGADGVIVELCDSDDPDNLFFDTVQGSAVVLIGTDVNLSEETYTVAATDGRKIGAAIADAVIAGEEEEEFTVGVLTGNQKMLSLQQRLEGFTDAIEKTNAEILWSFSSEDLENSLPFDSVMEQETPDVLVALDNDEIERAIDFLCENPELSCSLYGEGRSEKAVYYLDKGMINELVVPDEYSMGYQSIEEIAQQLEKLDHTSHEVTIDYLSVTRDQMYDEEVGKILFPVI